MAKLKLRGNDLIKLGYPEGKVIGVAMNVMLEHHKKMSKQAALELLANVLADPERYIDDPVLGKIVATLEGQEDTDKRIYELGERKYYKVYGAENIEYGAIEQMETAVRLPITVAGALMPDAHHGYGLPIGGVLATDNAVIPYGVGVDIGCRMCLTLYDMPVSLLEKNKSEFKRMLNDNTRFSQDVFSKPMDDAVLVRDEFSEIKMVKSLKDKAYSQIGTSGGGNHFVEFGVSEIVDANNEFGLPVGEYLAVLSHSGSRGLGASIAHYYTKLAQEMCKLPKGAVHLAWLSLDTEEGQEYWRAMNLAGDYASACHHHIHKRMAKALGHNPLTMVENHHNFAWKEKLADGKEVIVHRKGATPAGKGVLGIIPGSMTAHGFIVRGKGDATSINSASHGAGRVMSRSKAKAALTEKEVKQHLQKHGVELIGGGLDEAPMVYKDIHAVMANQKDLVEVVGTFLPKIVRMAGD